MEFWAKTVSVIVPENKPWPRWARRTFILLFPISVPIWLLLIVILGIIAFPIAMAIDAWNDD